MKAKFLFVTLMVSWLLLPCLGLAQEELPIELNASGRLSWIVKYGLGDAKGLAMKGFAPTLILEQALAVNVEGAIKIDWPISGLLSVAAQLDNQKAENLQLLTLRLDAENFKSEFGDFSLATNPNFAIPDRKLKGIKLEGNLAPFKISGVLARVEGISEHKIFRGNTSSDQVIFSLHDPGKPWLEQPYFKNIRGLKYYELVTEFVPGFTKVQLSFQLEGLRELLADYELGYLIEQIKGEPAKELEQAKYEIIFKERYYLILRREVLELLRDTIKEYINDYNQATNLSGAELKKYPLNEGTEYELSFLMQLSESVSLKLNSESIKLKDYRRQRFYWLGYNKIIEGSVRVEVKLDEDEEFIDINDPSLVGLGYSYELYPEEGIISFDFPDSFWASLERQIRVSFSYAVSGGLYILGLSIVRGSEKVYLNGKLLQQGIDYSIDYETGALILFQELGPEDILRIEYEIFRGGLGGFTEYGRSFSGISLAYKKDDFYLNLDLLQGKDQPSAGLDKSRLRTMPNTHTVAGLSSGLKWGNFQADLELGYNINVFPFDDNQRVNELNKINVIRHVFYQGKDYLLFGHQNGLTLFDGSGWHNFDVSHGLAGRAVYDIAFAEKLLFFATESGLSYLKLEADFLESFAKAGNWHRLYKRDGLASNIVYSAFVSGDTLWLGTAEGLNKAPVDGLERPQNWKVYKKKAYPQMLSDKITKIAGYHGMLFLGTDEGLMIFNTKKENFSVPEELKGQKIKDIKADGESIYVATPLGIRAYWRGRGSGWMLMEGTVDAIAVYGEELWYGNADGLYRLGEDTPWIRSKITSLASSPAGIWVGSEATSENYKKYEISIWKVANSITTYTQRETWISGRDEGRFQDIEEKEHTAMGPLGRLTLQQELGKLKLKGVLEAISPKYTAIGSENRQGYRRWSLGGSYELTPNIELTAEHSAGLFNLEQAFGRRISVRDSVGLRWKLGPQINLDYSLERVAKDKTAGFDNVQASFSASLSESFFDERLLVSLAYKLLSWKDLKRPRWSYQDHKLIGEISFEVLEGLLLQWTYISPVRTRNRDGDGNIWKYGEEEVGWSVVWAKDFYLKDYKFSLDANWNRNTQVSIPRGDGLAEDEAKVTLRLDGFNLGDLKLSPRGAFSWQQDNPLGISGGSVQLVGEGSLRAIFGDLNSQIAYRSLLNRELRSRRDQLKDEFSVSFFLSGRQIKPGLDFQRSLERLIHPRLGERKVQRQLATASLTWIPTGLLQNSLSFSWQSTKSEEEDTTSYSLRNSTSLTIGGISSSLKVAGSLTYGQKARQKTDKFEVDLSWRADWKLAADWNASVLGGYLLGIDNINREGSYQSLYTSLQVGMNF